MKNMQTKKRPFPVSELVLCLICAVGMICSISADKRRLFPKRGQCGSTKEPPGPVRRFGGPRERPSNSDITRVC